MGMQIKINDNQLREITATLSEIRQRFKTVTTDTHFCAPSVSYWFPGQNKTLKTEEPLKNPMTS